MPYFVDDNVASCDGWATVKGDGTVIGCHNSKDDAISQMVAVSMEEGIEPGGERSARAEADEVGVGDFVRWRSAGGLARGKIERVVRSGTLDVPGTDFTLNSTEENPAALIRVYRASGDGWEPTPVRVGHRYATLVKIDPLPAPSRSVTVAVRALPQNYRPALSDDVPEGRACGNCVHYREDMVNEDGERAWCHLWEDWVLGSYYCNRWAAAGRYMDDEEDEDRQVNTDPPGYIKEAASRGLDLRADGHGGDGLTERTIREARAMARGEISEDKIIRANAWSARHASSLNSPANNDAEADGWPGPGAVSHYLWGINPLDPQPARAWFTEKSEQLQQERTGGQVDPAPKDNIRRRVEFRVSPTNDGLTLEGYAAVFDEWTMIDSYEGTFRERVAPGAFRRTIGQRMPVLQFDHGAHPLIGSIPLGRITSVTEDSRGLRIRARLSDNWLVEPVRDAIRDGAINGMSFRFRVVDDSWTRGKDNIAERTIREVELYEVGPVVFPAYDQTTVGVRSRQALDALTDPQVRSEIAHILASGTDFTSLASSDDPAHSHSSPSKDPTTVGHSAARTKAQRRARAYLTLENITP